MAKTRFWCARFREYGSYNVEKDFFQCWKWMYARAMKGQGFCMGEKCIAWEKLYWNFKEIDSSWKQHVFVPSSFPILVLYNTRIWNELGTWYICWAWMKQQINWLWQTTWFDMGMCWIGRMTLSWEWYWRLRWKVRQRKDIKKALGRSRHKKEAWRLACWWRYVPKHVESHVEQ